MVYHKRGQPLGLSWVDLHIHLPHNQDHGLPGSHLGVYGLDRRWWSWVEDYTCRLLTYPEDQYAAVAGIVQLHEHISHDIPVVGLWKRHMPIHLAWDVHHDTHKHTIPLPVPGTRQPSWTWMSYPHGCADVQTPRFEWSRLIKGSAAGDLGIVYKAEVLDTDVRWSGEPLTSDPSGSTIRIRGVFRCMSPLPPVRNAVRGPLHLDPGISDATKEKDGYDTIALVAYVHSAVLINLPPQRTTVYLVIEAAGSGNKDEYARIGRMNLTENLTVGEVDVHRPKGVMRDITLV
jgi:hypothetical protein